MSDALNRLKTVRKRRYSIPIAVIVLLLCLLGLHTVGSYCAGVAKNVINKTAQKQEYERMLMPLVMFDTVTFEDPVNLDNTTLLQSSIWAILLGENRDYEYDEARSIVVPATDVDVACHKLFGDGVKLTHASFGDYAVNYYYDEEIKSYRIPLAVISGYYTPRVETITPEGDVLKLSVGYIPPASALNYTVTGETEQPEEPSKYMEYELRRSETGSYYVYALRLISSQLLGGDDTYMQDFGDEGYDISGEDLLPGGNNQPITDSSAPEGLTSTETVSDTEMNAGEGETPVDEDGNPIEVENPADYPTMVG